THQGTVAEVTVVQLLHQGTHPKMGCYHFRGSFFVSFLDKQKRIKNILLLLQARTTKGFSIYYKATTH
ncbi:MAG TPA: hypothetical protein VHP12_04710, partial [Chitinophagaceae bacterium]|nr:hypothetical protein [Chitinophagaceae bacterium]